MLPQRVYAKIDLDAICRNIKNAMDKVGKETKVMAIIKTDAYGHGAVPVAKALSEIGWCVFCGAGATEGVGFSQRGGVRHAVLRPPRKQWFYAKTASKTPYLFWDMFFRRIMTTL